MKLQNVPLDQIVANPWRDKELFPIDDDHVAELRQSIGDHGFFGGIKGRRINGKVEIGCGHARIAAARKAHLNTVPIFIDDDLDDDQMLRLMTDENATQAGSHAGAILNEVAAVTRRLIEGLFAGTIVPPNVAKAFDSKAGIERARSKLRNGSDAHLALGHNVIRAYLGQGNPERSHRGERQIREAISALKQSGRYDDIVEDAVRKYPPSTDGKPAKDTAVAKAPQSKLKRRILDERCASVFDNDHQFHAFREAVTTPAAQKSIPVEKQHALAKQIMRAKDSQYGDSSFRKKHVGAPYIKKRVHEEVQDRMKAQRTIDKEERERYLAEQREERIDAELYTANASLRSLISAITKLIDLAEQFPAHPKLGGFSARLDDLVNAIKQFSRKLK